MTVLDWMLVAIRWGHALAAVAWVGGGIFYLMVLRPAMGRAAAPLETTRAIGSEFRSLVHTAIAILLVSGIILSVSRLTEEAATVPYMAILALKIALALYMFYVARFLRQRAYPEDPEGGRSRWSRWCSHVTGATGVLVAGVIIIGLSEALASIFESGL